MNLLEVLVRPVRPLEEQHFQQLMREHHYLCALPKISETIWYVAIFSDQWVALVGFSAAASKCSARDRWIGWDFRHQYDRLKLLTNNSRFLILPDWHFPNLASRILSLCQKRLPADWQAVFGHPVVLLETFVDPQRVLTTNRGHWSIENSCHYIIDWNYDEDRSRIRKGHSPENITRLRRFAISIIKSKGVRSVPQKMRQLMRNVRLVFNYLRMTENSFASSLRC